MNLPKSLIICGKTYKVIFDKKIGGGCFDCGKQEIRITSKDHPEYKLDVLLHEVNEVILTEKLWRYAKQTGHSENGDYLFVCNHEQFSDFCSELAYVLRQIYGL